MDGKFNELRILIIEDSPVIAMAAEDMLRASGYIPLGPVGNMADALASAENDEMDAAIVDLNIRGTKTFSLLGILDRRGIPFLIVSGYANWTMPDEWADRPRLQKPFNETDLREKLNDMLRSASR